MRRGIGVAHVQKTKETKQQMMNLGAQITAERVGQIADQLEGLEAQLRSLSKKYKDQIKQDPVVRARFRQLADSLGVDLISSKKNVFAVVLGLGDFYYGLAGRVVEACMRERRFCGSFVSLQRIVRIMKKQYEAAGRSGEGSVITEGDVCLALDKLHVLGDGYNVVKLNGASYIQTTPDGSRSVDDVPLLDFVLGERAQRIAAYRTTHAKGVPTAAGGVPLHSKHFRVGASRVPGIGVPGPDTNEGETIMDKDNADVPLEFQCVALTQKQIESRLGWQAHRVQAVLERMVQNGSVWISHSEEALSATVISGVDEGRKLPQPTRKTTTMMMPAAESGAQPETLYWFVGLALQDEFQV